MTETRCCPNESEFGPEEAVEGEALQILRQKHNPDNEPTGHFTGRCGNCGSTDLWDDATAYGCRCCGIIYFTGDMLPRMIENSTGRIIHLE